MSLLESMPTLLADSALHPPHSAVLNRPFEHEARLKDLLAT